MEYLEAQFTIACSANLLQTARDLLADAAAEAGFQMPRQRRASSRLKKRPKA